MELFCFSRNTAMLCVFFSAFKKKLVGSFPHYRIAEEIGYRIYVAWGISLLFDHLKGEIETQLKFDGEIILLIPCFLVIGRGNISAGSFTELLNTEGVTQQENSECLLIWPALSR